MPQYVMTHFGPLPILPKKTISTLQKDVASIKSSLSSDTVEKLNTLLVTIKEIEEETGTPLSEILQAISDMESDYVEKQDIIDPDMITNDKSFN